MVHKYLEVEVTYRKGCKNPRFRSIVLNVVKALSEMEPKAKRFDAELLRRLRELDAGYANRNEFPIYTRHGYQVDIYHPRKRIAIEVEKSEVKLVWKILAKFSVATRLGRVRYAILITPKRYYGKAMKTPTRPYTEAIRASEFMAEILWTRNLAIVGY